MGRMKSRAECRRLYEEGLARFAQPGRRDWEVTRGGFVNWGKAAGLSVEEIIADARAAGVTDRDGSIRSAFASSTMRPDDGTGTPPPFRPRAKKAPPPPRAKDEYSVRALVGDTARAAGGCADWLREVSPEREVFALPPHEQTAAFIRAILQPESWVYLFSTWTKADGTSCATVGRIGESVRRAREWEAAFADGTAAGFDRLVPNPLTGLVGRNKSGRASLISEDCVAAFPWLIVEFDDMPLPWQFAYWRAFVTKPHPLASRLAAVVYSGGKSLHALLRVGCATRPQWDEARRLIAPLFGAADRPEDVPAEDRPFHADGQAMRPRQGIRLPGVRRCDEHGANTGRLQEFCYFNPCAVES